MTLDAWMIVLGSIAFFIIYHVALWMHVCAGRDDEMSHD